MTATLVVDSWMSRCDHCGLDSWTDPTHSRVPGLAPADGCGTRFDAVAQSELGGSATGTREIAAELGLPFVGTRPWPRPNGEPSPQGSGGGHR